MALECCFLIISCPRHMNEASRTIISGVISTSDSTGDSKKPTSMLTGSILAKTLQFTRS